MPIYTPDIYITLGLGNALGESTESHAPFNKHLLVIANRRNVVTSSDGTVTVDLGTKDEAIKALRYALNRLDN